jgi:hypothetical protein
MFIMKKYIFLSIVMMIPLAFISCEDNLQTYPDGDVLTEDQVARVAEIDPEKLSAEVNGLYSLMKAYQAGTSNDNAQEDFGIPGIMTKLEHNGKDLVGDVTGYNWFSGDQDYTNKNYTYRAPHVVWNIFYTQIMMANSIIGKVPAETEDPIARGFLGQAYAIRAYDYFNLVQLYQFTYDGHQNDPAVPIVLDDTPLEQINNNPRASVQEVYDLIMSDLNTAVDLLEGASRPDKSVIDQSVAYGLRARVNLVMRNWDAAASDAASALSVSGEQPFSREDVSVPTFYDANASGILWGILITPEDDVVKTGIANFTSMFTSLCFGYGGYTTIVGTWKKINVHLYDQIGENDVRKGWWINENYESDLFNQWEQDGTLSQLFQAWNGVQYDEEYGPYWAAMGMDPYTNVKFGPENGDPLDPNNSTDFPLMRAEEMLLIQAEAKAMAGNVAEGKTILEDFVTTYRDPDYVSEASTPEGVQDEVWMQRRVEFWGEGISWFDIMRLKKPVVRKQDGVTNFGAGAIFNIDPETSYMLWPIPQDEIQANNGISDAENNKMGNLPTSDVKAGSKSDTDESSNNLLNGLGGFSKYTY